MRLSCNVERMIEEVYTDLWWSRYSKAMIGGDKVDEMKKFFKDFSNWLVLGQSPSAHTIIIMSSIRVMSSKVLNCT